MPLLETRQCQPDPVSQPLDSRRYRCEANHVDVDVDIDVDFERGTVDCDRPRRRRIECAQQFRRRLRGIAQTSRQLPVASYWRRMKYSFDANCGFGNLL